MGKRNSHKSRRNFLKQGIAGVAGVSLLPRVLEPRDDEKTEKPNRIVFRKLGRVGARVPVVSYGCGATDNPNLILAGLEAGMTHLDTANSYAAGDDGMAIMDAIIDRISVVHAADIRSAGAYEPVVLGTGMVPLRAILQRMRASGFDGWISVEEASRTGRAGFQVAVPYCRQVWANAA